MIEQPQPAAVDPTVAPAPVLPFAPGTPRPLSEDQMKQWQARVQRADAKAKEFHPQWERALKRYAEAKVNERRSEINALLDYRHVESKKAQLFHRTPEINLLPVDPQDQAVPYDAVLPLREKVLNYELGPDRAKAKRAIHKTLLDAIAASGWMICEVGYEAASLSDPLTGQDIPIWARRFMSAISCKRAIVPDDFHDTDFDQAPYLGYHGELPLSQARRMKWQIPDDYAGGRMAKDMRFTHDLQESGDAADPMVPYVKLWYRAAYFDPSVPNPECFRCLVLVDGLDEPAYHHDSPYQTMLPTGELSDDSLIGNPIHMDAIRDLLDSAYVPSDLVVGEQLSVEVNKFRTELMYGRKKRQPHTFVSASLGQAKVEEIAANTGPVVLPEAEFDGAGNVRGVVTQQAGSEPRDNYTAQEKCEQDWEQALGVSPNQAGSFNRTKRTATEVRQVAGNSGARAETDKDRVRDWAVALFRKFDIILQRTATQQEIVKILGQQGAMLWEQWRNLPGRYAYKIQPDSGQYVDAREYRAQKLDEYNLLRKDPLVNAAELVRGVVRALGYDAGKLVPQDAAPEKPDAPKIAMSFNMEEALANPAEIQLVLAMLEQSGYEIPPELAGQLQAVAQLRQAVAAMQETNPEHGGSADKTEPLNQHAKQKTGGVQGVKAA
jgi:hypothetical protein